MKRQEFLRGFETQLVHGGEPEERIGGAATMPIFQSSTFETNGGNGDAVRYIRYNNTPNQMAVAEKIAMLEGAEAGLVAGSGMAAISATFMALLGNGAHAITLDTLYGGTRSLLTKDLSRYGVETTTVNGQNPESWKAALRPETKLFYVETITNPQVRVPDLAAIVAFSREHDLISITDNTFATPVNFKAVQFGFDLALHSCSKYMNGHSDIVGGAVAGSEVLVDKIKKTLNHLGGTLDPHAAFLLTRGLKTLSLRVERHNANGQAMAEYLDRHPAVDTVSYPGLPNHPDHARACRLLGGSAGVLAFTLAKNDPKNVLDRLVLPMVGGSLGGPETLISQPALTSHVEIPADERRRTGIPDSLIRMSVGLETVDDLIADFEQALAG